MNYVQRVAVASLPFLVIYKPIGKPLSCALGALRSFLLSAKYPFLIDMTCVKSALQAPTVRTSYLESKIQEARAARQRPLLLIDQQDLSDEIRSLQETHGLNIIYFAPVQKKVRASKHDKGQGFDLGFLNSGLVGQLLQKGIELFKDQPSPAAPQEAAAPAPIWFETDLEFEAAPLTEAQFTSYFKQIASHIETASAPKEAEMAALLKLYFFFYTLPDSPFTLQRLQGNIARDLQALYAAENVDRSIPALAGYMARTYGSQCQVAQEELLYAIKPALSGTLYRMKRLASKVAAFVQRIFIAPFTFIWDTFGRGPLAMAANVVVGGAMINFMRKMLF